MAKKKVVEVEEAVVEEAVVEEAVVEEAVVVEEEPKRMVRYNGGGYLPGIPARDLSMEEWEALTEPQRAAALQSQMFAIGGE